MSQRTVAALIVHLTRIAHGDGFVAGLTPAQWAALRYYACANRFSRTPSAFAEFHGTTRGTASQTIKSLVARDFLVRTRAETDGRSVRLDLSDRARAILADDPFEALVRATGAVPPGARGQLAKALERMLGHLARGRCKRTFGCCTSCEHLKGGRGLKGKPAYLCGWFGEPLAKAELQQLCINFTPSRQPPACPA